MFHGSAPDGSKGLVKVSWPNVKELKCIKKKNKIEIIFIISQLFKYLLSSVRVQSLLLLIFTLVTKSCWFPTNRRKYNPAAIFRVSKTSDEPSIAADSRDITLDNTYIWFYKPGPALRISTSVSLAYFSKFDLNSAANRRAFSS